MKEGSFVKFTPTSVASEEFRQKVAALGGIKAQVLAITNLGVCTLLLPTGVSIEGHSQPFPGQEGCHYLDLHESHLTAIDEPQQKSTASNVTAWENHIGRDGNEGDFSQIRRDFGNTGDFSPTGSFPDD